MVPRKMIRPTIEKIEKVGSSVGYGKGFWALIACLVFAAASIVQIESSRATSEVELTNHPVTVERLPSSEALKLGVESRNR